MERFIFTNSRGDTVHIGGDQSPFLLSLVGGLGDVQTEIRTQNNSFTDGSHYIASVFEEREIPVSFVIEGSEYSEVSKRRIELTKCLNPKFGQGVLTYINDYITVSIHAVCETLPVYPDGTESRGRRFQKGEVNFICHDPLFFTERKRDDLGAWIETFEFAFEIPNDTGMQFGYKDPQSIVNVVNEGHVETGMEIEIKASGSVKNPSVLNVNTGEYIKILKTMVAGEVITINTNRGVKTVTSSIEGKIARKLDLNSTFFQLDVGGNLLKHDAEEKFNMMEMSVYHTPKLLGV